MSNRAHTMHGMSGQEAYAETQTNPDIKDGDILDLGYGNVGILVKAWPVVVAGQIEGFHQISPTHSDVDEQYSEAIKIAYSLGNEFEKTGKVTLMESGRSVER